MTEDEWKTSCDHQSMMKVLRGCKVASERKLRRFAYECAMLAIQNVPTRSVYTHLLSLAEKLSEGMSMPDEIRNACEECLALELAATSRSDARIAAAVSDTLEPEAFSAAAGTISDFLHLDNEWRIADQGEFADLLRCIFGNPFRGLKVGFRPVTLNPAWLTSTVLTLAGQMYESRDFSPMPILADALQDAGCDNEDVLYHCRQPREHVRGCWVVDLILGKS
jgi:hypothetical protein